MLLFSQHAGYGSVEYYTNYAIFFYVVCAELLLPSVVGFRMLVVMSCSRGHAMYHILSHSDLCSTLLFYFFLYLIPYSVERV
jgi:hypothetical protein